MNPLTAEAVDDPSDGLVVSLHERLAAHDDSPTSRGMHVGHERLPVR